MKGAVNCVTPSRQQKAANYSVLGYNQSIARDDEKRITAMMAKVVRMTFVPVQWHSMLWPSKQQP